MILYLPGRKTFWADTLSRMPQYNSVKSEVIKPMLSPKQLAAPVTTRAQTRAMMPLDKRMAQAFKKALETDEWSHKTYV